jgi:D-amino peptidase
VSQAALPAPEGEGAKYVVRCDLVGASGVVGREQLRVDGPEYPYARRMLMADLRALLEGLRLGGAREVVVYDSYASGRNIDVAELPLFATLLSGRPCYRADWAGGLDTSCAGLILLGAHAAAGVAGALMPHTHDDAIVAVRVNGRDLGEIGIETAIAGDCGVPLVMITGDAAAVAEGCAVAGEPLGVVVKDALESQAALCYPLAVTTDIIKRAAQQLGQTPPAVRPFKLEEPVTLEADLAPGPHLERMRELYPRDVKAEKTVRLKAKTITEAWAGFMSRWARVCGSS